MTTLPEAPTPEPRPTPSGPSRRAAVAMVIVGFVALVVVVVLAPTGCSEAAGPAVTIGAAAFAAGGISVTVSIRR